MSISLSCSALKSLGSLSDDERPVVAVRILPSAAPTGVRRAFHLALLLDVSGSMHGPRIDAVKQTLHLLIDSMTESDVLTMITYETKAKVVAEAVVISADTRVVLHTTVDGLGAEGGTNLEAAFTELSVVAKKAGNPVVDAAFMMTDGHVNQGIAGSAGLLRLAGAALPAGTPINTLGYGAEHNARLLRDMAVRSRGSYTYADAAELLPAIIGDIMGGLAAEVGRDGVLDIPPGWRCLELGAAAGDTDYRVGTLIAEKNQWVVLEGPAKSEISVFPTIQFRCRLGGAGAVETFTCAVDDSISSVEVAEQKERAFVATVFGEVTEMLENGQLAEAITKLTDLGGVLDTSLAKDRDFVIRLRAQVDEMLEALKPRHPGRAFPEHGWPVGLPGAVGLMPAPAMPTHAPALLQTPTMTGIDAYGLAPVLSRMASDTAALGNQRGFFGHTGGGLAPTFSSPAQRHTSGAMTARFTQIQSSQSSTP